MQAPEPVDNRRVQLLEVLVFLLLIVPSMVLSLFVIRAGGMEFVPAAVSVMLRDLSLVCLILYFLRRNGEPLDRLGWDFRNFGKEAALGVMLFIPMFLGAGLLDQYLQQAGLSPPATPGPAMLAVKGRAEVVLAFFLVVLVAFAEETIFRGYLLLRFRGVNLGLPWAVLLSAVLFSLGHGYEGSSGVITVGAMGLWLAVVYVWRRSLVAPMVMHFLQDFIGIVAASLISLK